MPMLAATWIERPSISSGRSSAAIRRSATRGGLVLAGVRRARPRTRHRRGARASWSARATRSSRGATPVEHAVAERMPERVVDALEVVEVGDHHDRARSGRARRRRSRRAAGRAAARGSRGPSAASCDARWPASAACAAAEVDRERRAERQRHERQARICAEATIAGASASRQPAVTAWKAQVLVQVGRDRRCARAAPRRCPRAHGWPGRSDRSDGARPARRRRSARPVPASPDGRQRDGRRRRRVSTYCAALKSTLTRRACAGCRRRSSRRRRRRPSPARRRTSAGSRT